MEAAAACAVATTESEPQREMSPSLSSCEMACCHTAFTSPSLPGSSSGNWCCCLQLVWAGGWACNHPRAATPFFAAAHVYRAAAFEAAAADMSAVSTPAAVEAHLLHKMLLLLLKLLLLLHLHMGLEWSLSFSAQATLLCFSCSLLYALARRLPLCWSAGCLLLWVSARRGQVTSRMVVDVQLEKSKRSVRPEYRKPACPTHAQQHLPCIEIACWRRLGQGREWQWQRRQKVTPRQVELLLGPFSP
jgi:hypothetical protein